MARARSRLLGLLGIWCLVVTARVVLAQSPPAVIDREYEIKAKYLYFLAAFIEPTNKETSRSTAPIRIAVIGPRNSTLWQTAEQPRYQRLGERKVEWVHLPLLVDFEKQAKQPWNIVFLMEAPADEVNRSLDAINQLVADQPRLIVTEQNDAFRRLAMVNFYEDQVANRIRMQIRVKSLTERNLTARPEFLQSEPVKIY